MDSNSSFPMAENVLEVPFIARANSDIFLD
jgi:hypothetical protein